jgi:hypothetical protein
MRGAADIDQAFWAKPTDAEAGWMNDLAPESTDAVEGGALDALAASARPTVDPVFHELRDLVPRPPAAPAERDDTDDDGPALPPAATVDGFDFAAVTDDLLPSWNLGLG